MRVVDCPEVWPRTCSGGSWGDTRVLSYSGLVGGGKCSHLLGDLGRIEKRGVEGRISWGRKEEARLLLLTPHLLVGILRSVGRHMSGVGGRRVRNDGLTALQYRTKDATGQQNNTHHRHTTTTIGMSEIDHIFSKPKSPPVLSSSAKKRRKKKSTKPAIPPSPPSSSRKRPPPETVVDNSSGPSKRPKHVNDTNPNPKKSVKIGPVVDPAFKDSRGTSNRRFIAP